MILTSGVGATIELCYRAGLGQVIYLYGVAQYGSADRWSPQAWCCACKRGPACDDPGKHPKMIKGVQEHGSHDGCADRAEAQRRWEDLRPGPVNIGIVPAADVIVLDIDPRNGADQSLAQLEQAHGPMPGTLAAHTGGGGTHLWWRTDGQATGWKSSIGPGLDIKTAGGLLVAAPSRHANGGRRYGWRKAGSTTPSPAPTWLVHAARTEQHTTAAVQRNGRTGSANPIGLAGFVASLGHGEHNDSLFWALCRCYEAGEDETEIIEAARSVGHDERRIRRTVRSARSATR
jgi:hypothetical protein